MKKTIRSGKKALSVFLSVLMVLTAWVWVAPEKAEAAEPVGVTSSFTLSPNGNRGSTDWTRLALTGEGAAAGTSIIVFNFSNTDVRSLATSDEVILKFYAYSCPDRLTHKGNGDVMADAYYVTSNQSYVDGKIGTSQNITDTGNTILGTTYTGTSVQSSAKNYFGLSDSTKLGTFTQPAIDGQNNSSNQSGTANFSFNVTDIVKAKAETSENLSFVVMLQSAYNCSNTLGWSDIYINSDTIALSGYNAAEEAAALKSAIENFEAKLDGSKFYNNISAAYGYYNNAKRYYDAVVYGGVALNASTAQNYINQLNNALGSYNSTYIDYLNTTITSQNGSVVGGNYRKNVVYYPWDFSWDITANSGKWTIQDIAFYWAMPNIVVGITDSGDTTFPVSTFFWTTTGSRYVRYLMVGSGTHSSGVVGSDDLYVDANWRVTPNASTHTVSGWASGDEGWGDWIYESGYDTTTIDCAESNDNNFSYSQSLIYQVSSYAKINKNSIGVNASSPYKQINVGYTFATADSANKGTTNYANKYASDVGYGYVYAVYMEPYKQNYQNWKSLIPSFSYKNYNGYAFFQQQQLQEISITHLQYQ